MAGHKFAWEQYEERIEEDEARHASFNRMSRMSSMESGMWFHRSRYLSNASASNMSGIVIQVRREHNVSIPSRKHDRNTVV